MTVLKPRSPSCAVVLSAPGAWRLRTVLAAALLLASLPAGAQGADGGLEARPIDPVTLAAATDNAWRRPELEVYRWDGAPGFLIIDTRDYLVQQRIFHRLAFFVEKAGHVGRLEEYDDIAGLNGYLAHNYYNEDLAIFFSQAESRGMALLPEEQELVSILLANGSLRRRVDRYEARPGGVLSISREAAGALRRLHVHHELSHAAFYLVPGYSAACRRLWAGLAPEVRQYYRLFLAWRQYDVTNNYLLVNEFQGWTLHHREEAVEDYFRGFAAAQAERNLPRDGDTYRAIVGLAGEPFRDVQRSLREALAQEAPQFARVLDRLR